MRARRDLERQGERFCGYWPTPGNIVPIERARESVWTSTGRARKTYEVRDSHYPGCRLGSRSSRETTATRTALSSFKAKLGSRERPSSGGVAQR